MSTASILPTAARGKRIPTIRRLGAWLASRAADPKAGLGLVTGFAAVHAVLWTLILVNLKAGQDVHMDVAEAYAWGQKFLLGYGKHPPLSGWVAGVWFRLFPVTDWATYALAMATLGCGLVICWLLAPRVLCRGDAGALSDLQLQGLQVQSGPAAARHAAARRAGLSRRVREAQHQVRRVARARRCAGADDQILGADHDRRHRPCRADSSPPFAIPALAGAVGRDCHVHGGDAASLHVAEAGGLCSAHLCRGYLLPHRP